MLAVFTDNPARPGKTAGPDSVNIIGVKRLTDTLPTCCIGPLLG